MAWRTSWPVRARMTIVCGSVLLAACTGRGAQPGTADLDRDADAYVRVVLALAERDPDSLDAYDGTPSWRADARAQHLSLAEVRRSAQDLLARLDVEHPAGAADGAGDSRRAFLRRQLRAIVARVDVLDGVRRRFAEESRLLFGVDVPPMDGAPIASAREALDRLLPGPGLLTRRLADFERRFLVPPERLPQVLSRAIEECRRVTLEHIDLPPGEHVTIEYVHDLSWSAFTRYEGDHRSRITVNASLGITVDDVLRLACHEAYPGHHVINILVDDRLARAEHRKELMAQLLFSPQSLLAEGAASVAAEVAFPEAVRAAFERTTPPAILTATTSSHAHPPRSSVTPSCHHQTARSSS